MCSERMRMKRRWIHRLMRPLGTPAISGKPATRTFTSRESGSNHAVFATFSPCGTSLGANLCDSFGRFPFNFLNRPVC